MKKTKRISSFLAAVCLAVSLMALPVSAAFSDVAGGRWYTESVEWASSSGYVSGYEDGTFRPDQEVTRAEFCAIMNKVLNLRIPAWSSFSDVPSSAWYTSAVRNCVRAGIIAGYSSDRFGPEDPVTRQQAAVILSRSYDLLRAGGRSKFSDDSRIADYAVGYVKAMVTAGFMAGMGSNQFQPTNNMTRAQMVTMLHAISQGKSGYQKLADHENIRLLVVGDSIAEGVGAGSKAMTFVNQLKSQLEARYGVTCTLNNQSVSGTASMFGYARTKLLDDQVPYDLIVICYGHNDSDLNFSHYYESMLRALHTKYPHASMIAVAEHTQRDTSNNPSLKMQVIQNLCDRYGVQIADTARAYNARSGQSLISSDGLHPNNDGHSVYCSTILDVVNTGTSARTGWKGTVSPADNSIRNYDFFTYFYKDQFTRNGNSWEMSLSSSQNGTVLVETTLGKGNNVVTVNMDNSTLRWSNGRNYTYTQKDYLVCGAGSANSTIKVSFASSAHADSFTGLMVCYGA